MFYCYQYITVVHFVAKVGTLIGENRYGFAGEKWYTLFYCLHLMSSSTQLLVNPIVGILPKYTEDDYNEYLSWREESKDGENKNLIICLCNLLYKIDLNDRDKKLLRKSIKKNKNMLKQLEVKKKDVRSDIMTEVMDALNHKYDLCE